LDIHRTIVYKLKIIKHFLAPLLTFLHNYIYLKRSTTCVFSFTSGMV